MRGLLSATLAVAIAACGSGKPAAHDDAAPRAGSAASVDATPVEIATRPLGLAQLADFGWRARAGHAAFRAARTAEHAEDWPKVVAHCKQALAADPMHLEAAWLLAAGLGKLAKPGDKFDALVTALQVAEAGDPDKWGAASLELPALQAFLQSATGAAWRARVDADRAAYATALARGVLVVAGGDIFAYDAEGARWYRATRTGGAVIGALALPEEHLVAYVTRAKKSLAIGTIDLAHGHTAHALALGLPGPIQLAYGTKPAGVWVAPLGAKDGKWRAYADGKLTPVTGTKLTRPAGAWLEVSAKGAVAIHRARAKDVSADWDDQGLASAVKLATSSRVVSVPSPGLIDGSTLVWSPDRAHVAFVAQLGDPCAATSPVTTTAAFVADAATGNATELERADHGLALEWLSDRALAIAGDKGLALVDLDNTRTPLAAAGVLVTPKRAPHCTSAPTPEAPTPEPEPDEPDDE